MLFAAPYSIFTEITPKLIFPCSLLPSRLSGVVIFHAAACRAVRPCLPLLIYWLLHRFLSDLCSISSFFFASLCLPFWSFALYLPFLIMLSSKSSNLYNYANKKHDLCKLIKRYCFKSSRDGCHDRITIHIKSPINMWTSFSCQKFCFTLRLVVCH